MSIGKSFIKVTTNIVYRFGQSPIKVYLIEISFKNLMCNQLISRVALSFIEVN